MRPDAARTVRLCDFIGLDPLAGGCQPQAIELTEGVEIGGSEGSVVHVEVFQMASVGTSIIGRPQRLPGHRCTPGRYTLNCEEPDMPSPYRGTEATFRPRAVDHGQ